MSINRRLAEKTDITIKCSVLRLTAIKGMQNISRYSYSFILRYTLNWEKQDEINVYSMHLLWERKMGNEYTCIP